MTIKQGGDLLTCPPDGGGRRHDFSPHTIAADAARGQLIDGRLVKSSHGAQRAGDQMQFVLNDEIGRVEHPAVVELASLPGIGGPVKADVFLKSVHLAKECAGPTFPWKAGKL